MKPTMDTPAASRINTKQMTLIGLVTAITCIISPFTFPIPFSPVPLSLATLVFYISIFILGYKAATLSCVVYLLLGTAGLPVFSGFGSGLAKLAGPTGGYLLGYLFLTLIAGFFVEKFQGKYRYVFYTAGMVCGTAVMYMFGTLYLAWQLDLTFFQGLAAGVIPYLPGDTLKIVIALILGPTLRKRLNTIQQIAL